MNLTRIFLLLTLLCPALGAIRPAAGAEILSPEAVQRAIDEGTRFLTDRQRSDGSWEEDAYRQYAPGTTSLCILALLSAGMTPDDGAVSRGLHYIEQFTPETQQRQTYPIALQTMVFCQADPEKYRARIEENVEALLRGQFRTENPYNGGWSYSDLRQNFSYAAADNSNSQFAVLALYEAQKAGIDIPDAVWKEIEEYWIRLQNKDGSWGYRAVYDRKGGQGGAGASAAARGSGTGTGSMTCAGIVALWVSDALRISGVSFSDGTVNCCDDGVQPRNRERIEKGFDWLTEHFSVRSNPGSGTYLYYYLYGLERTGRLTARRFFGDKDWYREGADSLLGIKNELSRSWKAGASGETLDTVATSFALLFLSKGRWPVLISKLQYNTPGSDAEWNRHPDDLDHLTRHIESAWGMNLTWQVIDADRAAAADYQQTPVLSISGRVSPLPGDPAARRALAGSLRAYLEQGGFILAEALDGDESFESGFRELMALILEGDEGDGLYLLPEDHPIWTGEAKVSPAYIRPLYGADLGCRTSVVLIPAAESGSGTASLSCLWELADPLRRGPDYADSVEERIGAALAIGQNILAYATGRDLKNKDEAAEEAALRADGQEQGPRRREFYASILSLGRGSPCAPRAIPRLMEKISETIPVQTAVRQVRPEPDQLGSAPLLFFHGRQAFAFTAGQAAALRDYFAWGGFLFANAVCGNGPFAESFETEMKKVFPDARLEPVPPDDPLFSSLYGGKEIRTLTVRRRRAGGWEELQEPPRLYGIRQDGRWVVLFSPYDVSCALEARMQSTCPGYTPESAYDLSVNIVLYALEHL